MHTKYGRDVKLISDERRACTVVLVQRLHPSSVCRLVGYATLEVSPRTGRAHALHVTFDLLLRMLFH